MLIGSTKRTNFGFSVPPLISKQASAEAQAAKTRTTSAKNTLFQALRIKASPLSSDAEKISAANWIDLIKKNVLELIERVFRRRKHLSTPWPC